jgi:outer membrane murein-binding lipoprotein Lpp
MAKALLGHVGQPDPLLLSDMRRLRRRVRDLEAEIARLRDDNDALAAAAVHYAGPAPRAVTRGAA